ncbi:MAG: bifunctional NAD(P)H-hydrate repair enzyme Nnr [Fimbriimonadales bacterium]
MKVLTAEQMRAADRHTIEGLGVPSLELMERAGGRMAEVVVQDESCRRVAVLCGRGNNGGDGWVVARRLAEMGRNVTVFPLAERDECSPDCQETWRRAEPLVLVDELGPDLRGFDAVVDAVYGTGYDPTRGSPDKQAEQALRAVASAHGLATVYALDIPSGLDATTGQTGQDYVIADQTITVQHPKLGMFQGSGPDVIGRLTVVDIGIELPGKAAEGAPEMAPADWYREMLPSLSPAAHKRTRGSILCIGGSTTMPGSVALTGLGALCAGAGLATCAVPESIHPIVARYFPELMTVPLPDAGMGCLTPEGADTVLAMLDRFDVLALGPGLTTQPPAREAVQRLLTRAVKPVVLDADGLNCLAEIGPVSRPAPLLLTPHAGEMARLLGTTSADVVARRFDCARDAAAKYRATILLKGAYTIVCEERGACWVNATGCPGLGTAGSGDVLTGAIAALSHLAGSLQRGALLGAYLHGLAGERCAARTGAQAGFTAQDIALALPYAIGELRRR